MPIVASTHISASDNFQLGDSTDDRHVLHGHLSGSYTSTGSFGRLNVVGSAEIAGPVYVIDNKQIYLGTGDDFSLYHNGSHSYINNTVGNIYYREDVAGASHIFMTKYGGGSLTSVFEVTDSGALLRQGDLTVNSNIVFPTTNAKISGSATSTGSFGILRLAVTEDVSLSSTGHPFQIGPSNSVNLRIDNNEIAAVNNGAATDLILQGDGGKTIFNNFVLGGFDHRVVISGSMVSGSHVSTGSFGHGYSADSMKIGAPNSSGEVTIDGGSGNITATNFVGPLTGNAATATKISSITNSNIVQLTETQTLTNKTLTSPNINFGSDAEGDIYYRNALGTLVRLARGTDDHVLTMNGNVPNWEASQGGGGSSAADDITAGDAAVTLTTTVGNITIDAQGNDTDIIFKGTDGNNDTEFMRIDGSTSKIGIGTDTPEAMLHIEGNGNPQLLIKESGNEFVRIGMEGTNNHMCLGWDDSDDMLFGGFSSTTDSGISEYMRIEAPTGYVGIGDTSPISELSVAGKISITTESDTPSAPADGHGWLYTKTDGKIYWQSADVGETDLTSGGGGGGSDTDWYSGTNFITSSFTPQLSPNVQVTGSMIVSGSGGNLTASLAVYGSGSEIFKVEGTNGTLFSVTDIMSGSIFSANLLSGLPVIEAFSDNKITFGQYADPLEVHTNAGSRTVLSGSQYSTASFGHYANISASVAAAGFGSGGGGGGGGGNLTTKGDIEAYTTSQTRLAVGTNDYVLTADSSTAAGIAWKVAGGGGGVTVSNNSNNRVVTGDGSNANAEANLTFDGSTLTVTGDATVTGDITIDDGGSLKEAGGAAALTFDASGDITKIGQSSAAVDQVLSWNGSKAVWAAAGGGGSSIWTTTGDYKSTTSPLRISGSASEGSLVLSGSATHPRFKIHGVSGNVLSIGNNVGSINTGSMFVITNNFGITHFEAFIDGTFAIGTNLVKPPHTEEHYTHWGKPLLKRTNQMFLSGSSPSGSNDYSGSSPTLEVHGSGSISYYQGLSGRLLSIDDDEHNYKPVSSSAPVSASAVFSVNSYFGSPLFEIFPDGTSNLFSNVWEQPILRRNHMMHLSGSSLPLASYSSEDYTLHVEGSGSIFKVQNEQSVKFNVESDAKSFNYRTGSILTVSDNAGVSYFNVFNDATFTLGTIADPIIKRNNSWHISSSNHNEETYSSNDYTVQIEGSGSNILAAGDSINTRFSVDEHDTLDAQKTILNISDQVGHPIISVRDTREGFRQATIITGSGGPFPTFTEHDRLLLGPQHWDTTYTGLGTTPAWHDTFTSEASEPIARSGDIIMLGTTSVTRGKLYHLQSATLWVLAGADVARSESNLLAVALDTGAANIVGMLVKGAIAIPTDLINGAVATGAPAYVSTTTAGEYDFTAPSTSGDRVRVVAYCLGTEEDDQILMYFDPDKTGITLS